MRLRTYLGIFAVCAALVGLVENPAHSEDFKLTEQSAQGIARAMVAVEYCPGVAWIDSDTEKLAGAVGALVILKYGTERFAEYAKNAVNDIDTGFITCEQVVKSFDTMLTYGKQVKQ